MEITKTIPDVNSFTICEIKEVSGKESSYEFMEIADIDNIDIWKNIAKVDVMNEVAKE